jgi:hypothetical protein
MRSHGHTPDLVGNIKSSMKKTSASVSVKAKKK